MAGLWHSHPQNHRLRRSWPSASRSRVCCYCASCLTNKPSADQPATVAVEEDLEDLELVSEVSEPSLQAGSMSDKEGEEGELGEEEEVDEASEDGSMMDGSASAASDGSSEAASDEAGSDPDLTVGAAEEARATGLRAFSRRDGARLGARAPEVAEGQEDVSEDTEGVREGSGALSAEEQEDVPSASTDDERQASQEPSAVDVVQRLLQGGRADGRRMSKAAMARAARFYEMEAELSDEDGEGGRAVVSDDEDEDDEDQGRDLVRGWT